MVILCYSWHFRIWDTTLLIYICVLEMFVCYPFLLCWLSLSFTIGFMPSVLWNVKLQAFDIIWNLASFICWYFSGHGPSPMCRLRCRLMRMSRQRRSCFSASIWFHWWVFHSFLFFFNSVFLYLYCFSVLFFERFFSFVLMSFRTCFSFMLSFDLFRRSAYCGILYAYFSCPVFVFFCPEVLFLFVWLSLEIIGVVFSFVSCHPVF